MTYLAPTLTCPTDPYSVEPGTNVPFIPATFGNCSKGCNYSLVYKADADNYHWENSTNWSYTSREQVSFPRAAGAGLSNSDNNYRFTVTNRGGGSAYCDFSVKDAVPTYGCPGPMEKAVNENVAVTPANIHNCTQGCNYKVTVGSATATPAALGPTTGYSYTSGSLGNVTSASAAKLTYYITLSNPAGDGNPCHFDVDYKANYSTIVVCSINTTSITLGESFVVNVSKASGVSGRQQNCSFTGDGVPSNGNCDYLWNFGQDITVAPTSTGSHDYEYYVEIADNGNLVGTHTCKWTVDVAAGNANVIPLTTTFLPYSDGIYTLTTGTIGGGAGPNTFKCHAARSSGNRGIGTIYDENDNELYSVVLSDNKDYAGGYSLTSNSTYKFEVSTTIDDLTCGLMW